MEERKKPEREGAGAREQREKGEMVGGKEESREMRLANIAGESYVSPKEASPAYAPSEELKEPLAGGETVSPREDRILKRSNIAGESFEKPVETREPHAKGKKTTDVSGRQERSEENR